MLTPFFFLSLFHYHHCICFLSLIHIFAFSPGVSFARGSHTSSASSSSSQLLASVSGSQASMATSSFAQARRTLSQKVSSTNTTDSYTDTRSFCPLILIVGASSPVNMSNCLFSSTSSSSCTGLYVSGSTLYIQSTLFSNFSASAPSSSSSDPASRSYAESNGAALFVLSSSVYLADSQFVNNAANDQGGAVFATSGADKADLGVERCLFEGNTAGGKGGGIRLLRTSARFVNTVFRGNSAAQVRLLVRMLESVREE